VVGEDSFPHVINWSLRDRNRITVVPPRHWLLLQDSTPFRASVIWNGDTRQNVESIPTQGGHIACFPPAEFLSPPPLSLSRTAARSDAPPSNFHGPRPSHQRSRRHGAPVRRPRPHQLKI
jgi:hypothetical protein